VKLCSPLFSPALSIIATTVAKRWHWHGKCSVQQMSGRAIVSQIAYGRDQQEFKDVMPHSFNMVQLRQTSFSITQKLQFVVFPDNKVTYDNKMLHQLC